MGPALLNLGCGAEVHPAFVNVDLRDAPGVVQHDLRQGIPFGDKTYDLVYHSTMLSHLRPADALGLTRECYRVLKPGGILRIVTEDLEEMCRIYLQKLEAAFDGDSQSASDYEWMVLELYDQATRENTGGGMAEYLKQDPLPNEAFVLSRIGAQGKRMIAGVRAWQRQDRAKAGAGIRPLLSRLKTGARRSLLAALFGPEAPQAFEIGRFRASSGQVSYRMYDRFSLRQLFVKAGFTDVSVKTARESGYPCWNDVNLDLSSDGTEARPHTIIMEGRRGS
jgi:SAM-dependent methyltransferase